MWLCMPQVFFYGVFVLVGQVLNARERFGPMMWAPIANNLVVSRARHLHRGVGHLGRHRRLHHRPGAAAGSGLHPRHRGPGARAGPVPARGRVPLPAALRLRGVGLGHTLRLGFWTLVFIVANQVAFIVVKRLGTAARSRAPSRREAAGSAVYEIGFLVSQVPHGVITVSLATAVIPTLPPWPRRTARPHARRARTHAPAGPGDHRPAGRRAACLGPAAADAIAYGGIRGNADVIGLTVAAFAPAMVRSRCTT